MATAHHCNNLSPVTSRNFPEQPICCSIKQLKSDLIHPTPHWPCWQQQTKAMALASRAPNHRYAAAASKDSVHASPSSVFELLSLHDGSPAAGSEAAQTPVLSPQGLTARKPRRDSRLSRVARAAVPSVTNDGPLVPGGTSAGVAAFLARQQARQEANQLQTQALGSFAPVGPKPNAPHGLPRAPAPALAQSAHPLSMSGDSSHMPEPVLCTTPPRPQKLPAPVTAEGQPGAHGSPLRLNRVRPALSRSSLDRRDSLSRSSSGSGFSRASSLNDAKVCKLLSSAGEHGAPSCPHHC